MNSVAPSKQFIVRGSIAIGIVVVILVVQTTWFRSLFHKKPLPVVSSTTTVGDIITQDTNGNGIADWEEKLWGLDPSVLYTNGVSNKVIIDEKKKALGADNTNNTPQNETDRLARELFTLTQALGQSGEVTSDGLNQIAAKLSTSINANGVTNQYSLKDIQTTKTSVASLQTYYNAMANRTTKYQADLPDIDVVISALETGDSSQVPELLQTAKAYRAIAKDIVKIPVPIGMAGYHLDVVNGFVGVADSFTYLQELDDNATNALIGIAIYNNYNNKLSTALIQMRDYLTRYGILAP